MSILFEQYLSPANEHSVFKGIPIEMRDTAEVRNIMMTGNYKVRYRGPRRKNARGVCSHSGQLTCLKEDATSFAIYPKSSEFYKAEFGV